MRLIDLMKIVIIEIIMMVSNNRDVNYLHSLQEKLHFMTLCKEKVLNFRANVMPKLSQSK